MDIPHPKSGFPKHPMLLSAGKSFGYRHRNHKRNGFAACLHSKLQVSDFFLPSTFGIKILLLLIYYSFPFLGLSVETNTNSDLPTSSLRPPRGEILPSFWEEYGTWAILGGICLAAIIGFGLWLLMRPKPPVTVPLAVKARRQLEALQPQPENGVLLSKTSQILRHYMGAVFGWPAAELTTAEFSNGLFNDPKVGPELADETSRFLRACDVRKFAPLPASTPAGVIGQALKLIDLTENRLAELNRLAPTAIPDANLKSPSQMQEPGRIANGA